MTVTYILQGNRPVPEPDLEAWQHWFSTANRHVADTQVGLLRVSTVFIGLNPRPFGGAPLLFETMILKGPSEEPTGYQERCSTWEEAEEMHKRAIQHARSLRPKHR